MSAITKTDLINTLWLLNLAPEDDFEIFQRSAMNFLIAEEEIQNKLITQMFVRDEEEGSVLSEQDIAHSESIASEILEQGIKILKERFDDLKFIFSNAKILQTTLDAIKNRENTLKLDWLASKGIILEAPVSCQMTTVDPSQGDISGQSSSTSNSVAAFMAALNARLINGFPPPEVQEKIRMIGQRPLVRNPNALVNLANDSGSESRSVVQFSLKHASWKVAAEWEVERLALASINSDLLLCLSPPKTGLRPRVLVEIRNEPRYGFFLLTPEEAAKALRVPGLAADGDWYFLENVSTMDPKDLDPMDVSIRVVSGTEQDLVRLSASDPVDDNVLAKEILDKARSNKWSTFVNKLHKLQKLKENLDPLVQWEIRFYLHEFLTNPALAKNRQSILSPIERNKLKQIFWLGSDLSNLLSSL